MRAAMRLAGLALAMIFAGDAHAHVGSPNTFFQGEAGPYSIRVAIRPPSAIPGLAEMSVRVESADVQRVLVLPVPVRDAKAARPQPDEAARVAGDANAFAAQLWLMDSGAYGVELRLEGARGEGRVVIPMTVAPIARRPMSTGLIFVLGATALLLFAGAIFIAGRAARERGRSPRAASIAAAACVLAAYAGFGAWWDQLDRDWQSQISKPIPIVAAAKKDGRERVLSIQPDRDTPRTSWTALVPDHGKLMHLFLIRSPALDGFAHVHPARRSDELFEVTVPPLPAGTYEIYGDVTFESGVSETLQARVELPALDSAGADPSAAPPVDRDDAWTLVSADRVSAGARTFRFDEGVEMRWRDSGSVHRDEEVSLDFTLVDAGGSAMELEPYMGMLAHAAIRRADGSVFAHLHPVGTYSMAAQQVIEAASPPADPPADPHADPRADPHAHHHAHGGATTVSFPYAFPSEGAYRMWVQMRSGERVRTGVFDFSVVPPK